MRSESERLRQLRQLRGEDWKPEEEPEEFALIRAIAAALILIVMFTGLILGIRMVVQLVFF